MAANKRDSTAVQYYNVDDALSLFREGKTYYEITWAKDKADHCRAYIDIDGKVDMDYDEYAFKNQNAGGDKFGVSVGYNF